MPYTAPARAPKIYNLFTIQILIFVLIYDIIYIERRKEEKKMTEKNKQKQERRARRIANGKMWTGLAPKYEPTKREKIHKNEKKTQKILTNPAKCDIIIVQNKERVCTLCSMSALPKKSKYQTESTRSVLLSPKQMQLILPRA